MAAEAAAAAAAQSEQLAVSVNKVREFIACAGCQQGWSRTRSIELMPMATVVCTLAARA